MAEKRLAITDSDRVAVTIRPGDTVLLRALVLEVQPGVGVVVELFSKTDQQQVRVRAAHVVELVMPDVPEEPADGTFLVGSDPDRPTVFRRDDSGCQDPSNKAGHRYVHRWYDVAGGDWIDWPTVVSRGVQLDKHLVRLDRPVTDKLVEAVRNRLRTGNPGTVPQLTSWMLKSGVEGLPAKLHDARKQVESALETLRQLGEVDRVQHENETKPRWFQVEDRKV